MGDEFLVGIVYYATTIAVFCFDDGADERMGSFHMVIQVVDSRVCSMADNTGGFCVWGCWADRQVINSKYLFNVAKKDCNLKNSVCFQNFAGITPFGLDMVEATKNSLCKQKRMTDRLYLLGHIDKISRLVEGVKGFRSRRSRSEFGPFFDQAADLRPQRSEHCAIKLLLG